MNLKECYEKMGGNYNDVISRLQNELLITTIVKKVLSDNSYQLLQEGMENNDVRLAFKGAHRLKGICMNLSFKQLSDGVSKLTEILRTGTFENTFGNTMPGSMGSDFETSSTDDLPF